MAKHASHILDMARKGAEHRYEELKAEIATLITNFPHLAATTKREVSKVSQAVAESAWVVAAEVKQVRRREVKWSAGARKAVSARMKAYWAARRKEKQ
jgi:hypothetical protein